MPIDYWFSTPIYYADFDIGTREKIRMEMEEALKNVSFRNKHDKLNPKNSYNWHTQDFSLSDISLMENSIEKYQLYNFKKELDIHLLNVVREDKLRLGYKFQSSWFTSMKKGQFAHIHNHGVCDLCGCYYFKTNGKDGSFIVHNTDRIVNDFVFSDHTDETVRYDPVEGRLLLFPSWVWHSISENLTDNERISFAFNIIFNRHPQL